MDQYQHRQQYGPKSTSMKVSTSINIENTRDQYQYQYRKHYGPVSTSINKVKLSSSINIEISLVQYKIIPEST